MRIVICYDISDEKRLKKTAKILRKYGRRIEKSVFECDLSSQEYQRLRGELNHSASDKDLITAYILPENAMADWICGKPPASESSSGEEKTVCFF